MTTATLRATRPEPLAESAGRVRLRVVPDCEPPFDDELLPAQRLRRLLVAPGTDARGPAAADPAHRRPPAREPGNAATPGTRRIPLASQAGSAAASATSSAAHRTATTMARALSEVVTGARPAAQLRDHARPDILLELLNLRPQRGEGLTRLQSVRVCQPADDVAEVSAVFRRGARARALAFRLERDDADHWKITALQVI